MANEYIKDAVAAASQKQDIKDVAAAWLDVHDIQKKVTDDYNKSNTALDKMLGFQRSIQSTVIDRFKKEFALKGNLKNLEKSISDLQEKSHSITDDALRNEAKVSLEGMLQRKISMEKELDLLGKINRSGLGVFLFLLSGSIALFKEMDAAAAKFRMTMGFTRDTAEDIRNIAQKTAINFGHVGVNIEGAYASFEALSKEMGSAHIITEDLVKTTSILKAQLGVSEEASAGFLRNMAAISGTSMQAQQTMAYMAASLSNAAGVPLGAVMKDIASRSTATLTMMSRIPAQVIRSAVELRKMGTDLDRASKSSRDILNFTDNINAEMEASVLLGRSINLQRARELAYHRDIVGSTKEIVKLTKSIDFQNLDVFQQEAFARATGKSVDELLHLVQAEKQWNAARQDPKLSGRVNEYERLKNANEANSKANAKNLETMLMTASNQERLTAISQKWNQILAQAEQLFLPIIDHLLDAVIPVMDIAKGIFAWSAAFKFVLKYIEPIVAGLNMVKSFFVGIMEAAKGLTFFARIFGFVGGIVSKLGGILKFAGIFGGTFGKAIPVLGEVIMAIQFIWNLFHRLNGIGAAFHKGILNGILFGLKAVGGALYDTLLKPFVEAWNWIKNIFVGHSPSALGMGIVKGITSVSAMLFDALSYPWRHFMAWVLDKIPGMGKFASTIRGGLSGITNKSVENETKAASIQSSTVTPVPTKAQNDNGTTAQAQGANASQTSGQDSGSGKALQDILSAINMLNANLEAGKIGIYIDGQLLSTTIARQTEFRRGFGTNNT